jgi:hypothetical protein
LQAKIKLRRGSNLLWRLCLILAKKPDSAPFFGGIKKWPEQRKKRKNNQQNRFFFPEAFFGKKASYPKSGGEENCQKTHLF